MASSICPRCGAASTGNFCSSCGSSLAAVTCPSCGTTPAPGARFCNKCGAGLAADAGVAPAAVRAGGDSPVAWWIAGGTLVALITLAAWPVIRPGGSEPAPAAAVAPFAQGGAETPSQPNGMPDLSQMTPREAADRLYDRVMNAVSTSDEATVQQFLPMALAAYDMAQPLDVDGMYHLSVLQRAGGDFQASLATAQGALATNSDHLLLVAAEAEAAEGLGDMTAAKKSWKQYLDVYDKQRSLGLEEYTAHEGVLESSRTHAREVVGG